MEGQDQQIRTMARDLAQAQAHAQRVEMPQNPASTAGKPAPILSDVKPPSENTAVFFPPQPPLAPPAPVLSPPKPPINPRGLNEILAEARGRSALPPSPPASSQKTTEDFLPIEETLQVPIPLKDIEPPDNLPTGQAGLPIGEKSPLQITPPPIAKSEPKPRSIKTPEEILGLPQRKVNLPIDGQELPSMPKSAQETKPLSKTVPTPPRVAFRPSVPPLKPLKSISGIKFTLIVALLGVITIGVLGFLFWNLFFKAPPPPPAPPPSIPASQPVPDSLILYDRISPINIDKLEYDLLKPLLDNLYTTAFVEGSLSYLPIKLTAEKQVRYITLSELLKTLQIDAPPELLAYENYTLFLYTQKADSKGICLAAQISDPFCYGPRLGLMIELPKTTSPNKTTAIMKEWEKTLINDFKPLMLFVPSDPAPDQNEQGFKSGNYKGLNIRYINMPIHTMSIDWILKDTYLIIATSKDAARTAVEGLP